MSEMGYGSIEEIMNWPRTRFTKVQNKLDKKLKKNRNDMAQDYPNPQPNFHRILIHQRQNDLPRTIQSLESTAPSLI